jgi:hypothetical protein
MDYENMVRTSLRRLDRKEIRRVSTKEAKLQELEIAATLGLDAVVSREEIRLLV